MTRVLGRELEILLVFSRSSRQKPVPWARAFSRHRHGSVHGCGQEGEGKRVSQSGGHSRGSQGRGSPGTGGVTSSQRCAKQVSGSGAWACGPRAAGGFARGRPWWPSGARFCRPQADRRGGTVTGQGTCRFREKAKGPGAGGWCRAEVCFLDPGSMNRSLCHPLRVAASSDPVSSITGPESRFIHRCDRRFRFLPGAASRRPLVSG